MNHLNANPNQSSLPSTQFATPRYIDTDGNRLITPFDLLNLINYLNKGNSLLGGAGEGEGEGAVDGTAGANPLVWTGLVPDLVPAAFSDELAQRPVVPQGTNSRTLETKWYMPAVDSTTSLPLESLQADEEDTAAQLELEAILDQIAPELARR